MPREATQEQQTLESQESQQEQTISTNNQEDKPTKSQREIELEEKLASAQEYRIILEQQVRQQGSQLNQIQSQLSEQAQHRQVVEEDENATEFFKQPRKFMREIIREEVKAQVQPLNELASTMRATSAIDTYIARAKAHPDLRAHIDSATENFLRQAFSDGKAELTEANFNSAVVQAIGLRAVGLLPNSSNGVRTPETVVTQPPKEENRTVTPTPAHIRPTNPVEPAPKQKPNIGEPNELERRIMRENGIKTYEEYLQWMNMPAAEVTRSTLGREGK